MEKPFYIFLTRGTEESEWGLTVTADRSQVESEVQYYYDEVGTLDEDRFDDENMLFRVTHDGKKFVPRRIYLGDFYMILKLREEL